MGFLDGDNADILSGVAQGIKGGIQGYMDMRRLQNDEEDRKYRRMEMAAKIKAAETEEGRKADEQDVQAALKGYRVERDAAGKLKRDPTTGALAVSLDTNLVRPPTPLQEAMQQYYESQVRAQGEKPATEMRKMIADKAKEGFSPVFDDRGQVIDWKMLPWKADQVQADLELKKSQAAANTARARGKGTGGKAGKQLPASMAAEFGTSQSSFAALDDALRIANSNPEYFNENRDFLGKARNVLDSAQATIGFGERGEKAAALDADLMAKAQVIGKYLEGGKLAEGDIKRYTKMLPARGDTPGVVRSKVETLKRMIEQKMNSELTSLQGAGYNTSGIQRPGVQAGPGLLQGKIGLIDNQAGLIKSPPPGVNGPAPLSREEKIQRIKALRGEQ